MKIDLTDSGALKDLMSEAILRALDDATKEKLITNAIAHLIAPQEPYNGYGKRRESPLEEAYKCAVQSLALRMAHDVLDKDERVKEQVRSLLHEAMERAFVTHREATVERVANAIAEGLWKRDAS